MVKLQTNTLKPLPMECQNFLRYKNDKLEQLFFSFLPPFKISVCNFYSGLQHVQTGFNP